MSTAGISEKPKLNKIVLKVKLCEAPQVGQASSIC